MSLIEESQKINSIRIRFMTKSIGILTAGGDSLGPNAAIRAAGRTAQKGLGMHVIGFRGDAYG